MAPDSLSPLNPLRMKRTFFVLILLLTALSAHAQETVINSQFFTLPDWGTHPSPQMKFIGPLEDTADLMYFREDDGQWLKSAYLKYIVYVYRDDKFSSVIFAFKDGPEAFKFYLDLLTHFHGPATMDGGNYHWHPTNGKIPHIELLQYSEDKGNSFVYRRE